MSAAQREEERLSKIMSRKGVSRETTAQKETPEWRRRKRAEEAEAQAKKEEQQAAAKEKAERERALYEQKMAKIREASDATTSNNDNNDSEDGGVDSTSLKVALGGFGSVDVSRKEAHRFKKLAGTNTSSTLLSEMDTNDESPKEINTSGGVDDTSLNLGDVRDAEEQAKKEEERMMKLLSKPKSKPKQVEQVPKEEATEVNTSSGVDDTSLNLADTRGSEEQAKKEAARLMKILSPRSIALASKEAEKTDKEDPTAKLMRAMLKK